MAAVINLRRDLPKVLADLDGILERVGDCEYQAPCVIGVMMNPRKRKLCDEIEYRTFARDSKIETLIDLGEVRVPADQRADVIAMQRAFDKPDALELRRLIEEAQRKYLAPCDRDGRGEAGQTPEAAGPVGQQPGPKASPNPDSPNPTQEVAP